MRLLRRPASSSARTSKPRATRHGTPCTGTRRWPVECRLWLTTARNPRTLRPMQNTVSLTEFLKNQMPDVLEALRQMVGINSFTSNREGANRLGRFTAQCFAPLGFAAEFVPSANLSYGDPLVSTRPGR